MSHTASFERKSPGGSIGFDGGSSALLDTAGFAHELGNLIQIASSAVSIVARDEHVRDAAALLPVLAGARSSLERAGSLVRRTMRQPAEPEFESVDIARCLSDLQAVVEYTWSAETRLELRIQPDLPLARCDALKLHNAILNLALNARDSMPDGGKVVIAAETAIHDAKPLVQISVTDTGIGMTPETARRAFDPFFTTKSRGLGGLGLPMVRRFVVEAGGSLSVDSRPGVGTAIILRLPVWQQTAS